MKKKKQTESLVTVLEPTTSDALVKATHAVDTLPSFRGEIVSAQDYEQGGVLLRQVATAKKTVEDSRKSVTKHLDAAKKALNALFKPLVEKLDATRALIEEEMARYDEQAEQEAEAEREKLRAREEAQRKRLQTLAKKRMERASSRTERHAIQSELSAKLASREAMAEQKFDAIEPDEGYADGVYKSEDVEVDIVDPDLVPRTLAGLDGEAVELWEPKFHIAELKKLGRRGVHVPGVSFTVVRSTRVRAL